MLKQKYPNKLILVFSFLLIIIFVISLFFFQQNGENSQINFHIDFELKNKILNMVMNISFDLGLKKIADAFEKRAIDLFKRG